MVKEVNRRAQRSGVLLPEGFAGAPFENKLDQPLVMRMHQEEVEGKGPQHAVRRLDFIDSLFESALVLLQFPDLLGDVEYLELVLGELLLDQENVLQRDAEVSLGA